MKHVPLVGMRRGKRVLRWPVLLARLAIYLLVLAVAIHLVTRVSDWVLREQVDRGPVRVLVLSLFLTALFTFHDLRRDSKMAPNDLPDLDRATGSKAQ